jgi:hypothetical protein
MRTFAQKQNQPQRPRSSLLNPASAKVEGMLLSYSREPEPELIGMGSSRVRLDFSKIPIFPHAIGVTQTDPIGINPGTQNTLHSGRRALPVLTSRGANSVFPAGQTHHGPKPSQSSGSASSGLGQGAVPPIVHEVINSSGQSLDASIRGVMEPRFGYDFGHVRVHAGPKAANSAKEVSAIAYTIGQHVVIGERGLSPESVAGRQLWAHELAHVVQQSRGGSRPEVNLSAPHERDAHAAATLIETGLQNIRVACARNVSRSTSTITSRRGSARARYQASRRNSGRFG